MSWWWLPASSDDLIRDVIDEVTEGDDESSVPMAGGREERCPGCGKRKVSVRPCAACGWTEAVPARKVRSREPPVLGFVVWSILVAFCLAFAWWRITRRW